jgi:hypothetical protein
MNPPKAVLPILRKLRNSETSDGRSVAVKVAGDAAAVTAERADSTVAGVVRLGRAAAARRPAARLELFDFGMVLLRKSVCCC